MPRGYESGAKYADMAAEFSRKLKETAEKEKQTKDEVDTSEAINGEER